ncbi:MAG TPA: ABC transporter permease, partial [Paracoccaceae bacterium]|nr:ABC transporter permease [Paracoccaceae bacterium]
MPEVAPTQAIEKQRNQWRDVWDQFKTHKGALAGMTVLALLVAFVLIGPFL